MDFNAIISDRLYMLTDGRTVFVLSKVMPTRKILVREMLKEQLTFRRLIDGAYLFDYEVVNMASMIGLEYDSIESETESALLVDFGDHLEWIPKSQSTLEGPTLEVAEWLVIEKELDGYII